MRQLDEAHTAEFEDRLDTITVPTLILWGANDAWIDARVSEALERRIPSARRVIIHEAGHFVMEDQPQLVTYLLEQFFTEEFRRCRAAARSGACR